MYRFLLSISLTLSPLPLLAVSETDQHTYQFDYTGVSAPSLTVDNIWGDVLISTHDKPWIDVSVKEKRSANTDLLLQKSKNLIFLTVNEEANGAELIVDGIVRNWNRRNPCRSCEVEYQFEIKVPALTKLDVSTVNDGEVIVRNVQGSIDASNVNGGVRIDNASVCGHFNTVNGPIHVSYAEIPTGECHYETINGDIEVSYPKQTNADISFNLGHGEISSEIEVAPLAIKARIKTTEEKGRKHYQIHKPSGVRIGRGGQRHHFESMNGDLLIKSR